MEKQNFLNMINDIYGKTTANIFSGERLKAFSLRSGTRYECPHLPLLYVTVLEVLVRATEQEKNINKKLPKWKERSKTTFPDNMVCNMENPK